MVKRAPSSEHWNVAGSSAENVNVANVLVVVGGGPESIVVSGGVVSLGAGAPCAGAMISMPSASANSASAGNARRVCRRRGKAAVPTGRCGRCLNGDLPQCAMR